MSTALIVGGGICGAATAFTLSKLGFDVEIAELRKELTVLGNGITLIAPAMRALERLGVIDECMANGYVTDEYRLCDYRGNEITTLQVPPAADAEVSGILGMMRPDLHRILIEGAITAGTRIRRGVRPVAIEQDADSATVTLSDGTQRSYDLVIGADGLRSGVRAMAITDQAPVFRNQGCFRAVLPRPDSLAVEHNFSGWPTAHAGVTVLSEDQLYLWLNAPMVDNSRLPADEVPHRMRELLEPFKGPISELRDLIRDPALTNYTPFETIMITDPWNSGRIMILGDAAHSTTPQLAAGGAMCLEDAVVLGEELSAAASVPAALDSVFERRVDRCRFVVETSVQLAAWQLAPDTPGATPPETTSRAFAVLAQPC
ncbi:FAD-dependent monooxygenase [Nocardia abscessus]|uniref:FAD-dependent monooxygenase n=1 Tax=Nocardia abscessus TaxID=120957 RepID=UPI002456BE6D|nr:FAD-dependent monooxygenase [Nocardia abscessus]